MKLEQLKALVRKGESGLLEFKKSTAQLSTTMQTVCAFLNSEVGGTVLIGVTDEGKIIGQQVSDATQKEIAGELSKIEPHVTTAWDSAVTADYTIDDLDKKLIQRVINIAVSEKRLTEEALHAGTSEILKKLDLIINGKLTNASVVLFCKNDRKQPAQSMLKLARFKGTSKLEFIDNKQMRGNIFYLYEQAMTFLSNYLPIAG